MTIPSNLRIPLVFAEFNSERAFQGSAKKTLQTVMIAQKTSAGTGTVETVIRTTSADQAKVIGGIGSQIHQMAVSWFAKNKTTPLYIIPVADNGAAVAAAGTVTFTGPASASGVIYLYVNGERITAAVASGDTATIVAAAVVAAVNAATSLPVTAANSAGVVTLTAKNLGACGNDIDIRTNYNEGETYPTGIAATIVAMASGATNPVLTNAIAALGERQFDIILAPYYDSTSLTAIETELDDRWLPTTQIDGQYISARPGSYGTLTSFGAGRNSKHVTIVNANNVPSGPWKLAASVAAACAMEASTDPARPLQTIDLPGILPPSHLQRFTPMENNGLLFTGISTFYVDEGNVVRIQRLISMYQTNVSGLPDIAYLNLETKFTLSYIRYSFRVHMSTKFPRAKLVNDASRIRPGQSVISPATARAECVAWFKSLEADGIVENFEQFKKDLVVQRSASDPNRLEVTLPPDTVNQCIVISTEISFLLESP